MEKYTEWKKEIEKIISQVEGKVCVNFYDLNKNNGFSINGDKKVPSASMIKLLIMLKLLEKVERKELDLEEKIKIQDYEKVDGSGILKELSSNHSFSIRELLTLMIIVSDNFATNILIEILGMDDVNELGEKLGLLNTSLQRKMMDLDAKEKGFDNYTSSQDILKILKMIYDKTFLSEDLSDLALDILLRQQERSRLQRFLSEDIKIASKSGDLDNLENDGGIFFTNKKNYILVVLVNEAQSNDIAKEIIGKISLKIYEEIGE